MPFLFYLCALIALLAAWQVIRGVNAMHALLYLIVVLLAIALMFFMLGAPFAAALEVIIYAGAIMVLMVFVIMMLNQGDSAVGQERAWRAGRIWRGPALLCAVLLAQLGYLLLPAVVSADAAAVDAVAVGRALYGPYLLLVELASMLLLAALVGAWHLTRVLKHRPGEEV
ncbi:NADH-quinone oxidoreductase subunit J [Marinobacterium sedimentorum]|uniref:NADH-quinone oxidoreductase subunit J n=1 Tax=Marinobacterium sedimentorum TaxID=2927804 RepID=UPI0020C65BDF|nr:NADH-quinone oxidoreductase subunit J [Marinobacterium sedimentorum]MCP8686189.1 NADH-quinone oxidoreductase subunit J [Marinobacterium sedimentorum]